MVLFPPADPEQQADRFFTQAMEWLRAGQLAAARNLLEQAIALNVEHGRLVPEGYARLALGRVRLELGEPAAAQTELEAAAARLAAAGDRVGQIRVLFELGELAEQQGQFDAARARYETILSLESTGADAALAHLRQGALERDTGEASAVEHYAAARKIFAETGNELGEARATLEEARLRADTRPEEARALFEHGLALAEAYAQDDLAAVAHLGLGRLATDHAAARTHHCKARELAASAGDAATAETAQVALDRLD